MPELTPLLDVNLLVALAWPNHLHHEPAHRWFNTRDSSAWATCPVTQSGFIRVSSNPRVISDAVTPQDAIAVLRKILAIEGHQFWLDDVSLATDESVPSELLRGYRQTTDLHLVALAQRREGRLATFDDGVAHLVPGQYDSAALVELIDSE